MKWGNFKTTSLTGRLTLWFTASTFLLVLIATGGLYFSIAHSLDSEDSLALFDKIQAVAQLLRTERASSAIRERVEQEWVGRKSERLYVKVLDQDGHAVTETPGFEENSRELFAGIKAARWNARTRALSAGRPPPVAPTKPPSCGSPRKTGRSSFFKSRSIGRERIFFFATYRSRLLGVLLTTLLITALIGRRIALAGMRPLSEITRKVSEIKSTTLHQRIELTRCRASCGCSGAPSTRCSTA